MVTFGIVLVLAAFAAAAPETRSPSCIARNTYRAVDGSCDAYIECRNYEAFELMCPDGLHYNPSALWPAYPCSYPSDTSCNGRGVSQPAIPSAECPHQYGFYPAAGDCGSYIMCVEGRAARLSCPAGLAFNKDTGRCDWPDLVAGCNSEAFLGFKCPVAPRDDNGEFTNAVMNYKYGDSCYMFLSCQFGVARLHGCDVGLAFDAASGRCIDSQLVACKA